MKKHTMDEKRLDAIRKAIDHIYSKNDAGDILEFGVFEGYSLSEIVIQKRKNNMSNKVYGFDSFSGLPTSEGSIWHKGDYVSTLDNTTLELKSVLGNIDDITLVADLFEKSLPTLNDKIKDVALVHVDSDLYSSAVTILNWLSTRIRPGTMIIFDEWSGGESKAWEEFANKNNVKSVVYSNTGDQVILEVR